MAKNTNVSAFRKIDIDSYNPENYQEEESNVGQGDDFGPNENEIVSLLNTYFNLNSFFLVNESII